jgi:hypothetical protein
MEYENKKLKGLLTALLLTTVGCSTPIKNIEQYYIHDLRIVLVDERKMSEVLSKQIPHTYDPFAPYCTAYYDTRDRTAYVPYSNEKDKNGKYLPNFEMLGHEVYHYINGNFHEGSIPIERGSN